jgi:rubrerythrin
MEQWKTVDEILDFAINQEQEAYEFYEKLGAGMARAWMKEVFAKFAKEELGHKMKLTEIKQGKQMLPAERKVLDLKISDYLVDVEPGADLDYQKALITAMKKEKKAFKMYNDLADAAPNESLRDVFLALAQEEAKHKLRFELEYDDIIMSEN